MKKLIFPALVLLSLAASPAAKAITISGAVGGAPTGAFRLNFDDLIVNSTNFTSTTSGPAGSVGVKVTSDGQVASGSVGGQYAAPFLSGGNGVGFGPSSANQANGADATPYLTTGKFPNPGGSVTLDFGSLSLNYFGLLWGSIDSYNTLQFFNGLTLVDTVTGTNVLSSANGNQGVNGTLYVNINTSQAFNRVVATSSQYAFEFDNVAYSPNANGAPVPDGGMTAALLGMSLTGLAYFRRKLA